MPGMDAELYDVLDDDGHKTGERIDLPTIHKTERWHEVVNVWVINSRGELLMQLRAPNVELSPNVWDVTVGTHMRPGEEPLNAATRVLFSELGLQIMPEKLKHLFNAQAANPMPNGTLHKVVGHVFLLEQDIDIASLHVNTEKIAQIAWVPLNKLMMDIGGEETKKQYFPRASNYYPRLFEAFQAWM